MAKRDYYEVLGVEKNSTLDVIKKAYRKKAIENHPDKNPNDKAAEERFKEATEAYEILSDESKRKAYDQYGFAGVNNGAGAGYSHAASDFADIFGSWGAGGWEDIFSAFSGGSNVRRNPGGPMRGSDLRFRVNLDFKDAVFGTKVDISYSQLVHCKECNATGSKSGSGKKICPICHGAGQVQRSSGFFSVSSTCSNCNGEGYVIENPCPKCSGSTLVRETRKLKVVLPEGIDNGYTKVLSSMGDAGRNGGPNGDLLLVVMVKDHEFFARDGYNLQCVIPISITQAALGDNIKIESLDGKDIDVQIPAGSETGSYVVIKKEGVKKQRSLFDSKGDLYVKFIVKSPKKLSSKAKDLLLALKEELKDNPRPKKEKIHG